MFTYLIYKECIYDCLIKDMLIDFWSDFEERVLALILIIIFGTLGIMLIILDVLLIPIYLIVALLHFIFH